MKGVNTQSHRQGLTQSTFSKEVEALKKAYLEKLDLIGNVDPQLIEAVSQAVQQYQTHHQKKLTPVNRLLSSIRVSEAAGLAAAAADSRKMVHENASCRFHRDVTRSCSVAVRTRT